MRPKYFQGYVVLWLETTLSKIQFFVTIFAHSATPTKELQYSMSGTICDQYTDMVRIEPYSWHYRMNLSFAIHEAALLKHETIQ